MNRLLFRLRFNAEARAGFYEAVANFTGDGVPLYDCLGDMLAAMQKDGSWLCPMLRRVMGRLRGKEGPAMEFGQALAEFVPAAEMAMVSAGERSGDLALGLRKAMHLATSQQRLVDAVLGELVQPAIYIVMVLAVLVLLSKGILPTMEKVAARPSWPVYARLLGALADVAVPLVLVAAGLVGAWTMLFLTTAPRLTGVVRARLDRWVFPWGLYAQISEVVLLLTAASMIRVGLPFETAIESIQKRSSDYMRVRLVAVRGALRRGANAGVALTGAINNRDVRWQIEMYSRTTAFAPGLEKLADRGVEALIKKTRRVFQVVGFAVLVLVAVMVVWVLGSFFGVSMSVRASRA